MHTPTRRSVRNVRPVVRVVALLGLAAVTFVACGDDEDAAGPAAADLEGRTFVSTAVEGRELVEGSTVSLSFEEGRVAAQAGCNTMSGSFTIDGDELQVEQLAQTQMACDQPLMDQDTWVAEFLDGDPTITLDGDQLTLVEDGVTMSLAAAG
jgi:heat shock protein HslJ